MRLYGMKLLKVSHSVTELEYHFVWVTKYRNKALTPEIRKDLTNKITEIVEQNECKVIALMVMENHVHLEIAMTPKISVMVMIKKLKGTTAHYLFHKYPELRNSFYKHHLWSPSYFAKTTGNCSDKTIQHYINTQWERDYK